MGCHDYLLHIKMIKRRAVAERREVIALEREKHADRQKKSGSEKSDVRTRQKIDKDSQGNPEEDQRPLD